MSRAPSITILLPVYNGAKHIAAAIESALAQSDQDFELLVGNDGSTDETRDIVLRFTDPRIRFIDSTMNRGQFGNLNHLLGHVRTDLIKFLCHDDILMPECVAAHRHFFAIHENAVVSMCQAEMFNESGVLGYWPIVSTPFVYESRQALQLFLYHGCAPGNLTAVCVRREALSRIDGFDVSYSIAGDYDAWVRACEAGGGLGDLQQCLIRERHHDGRVSFASGAGVCFVRENRRIRARLLPLMPLSIRRNAARFVYLRPNVLDTNQFLSYLRHGHPKHALELLRVMGSDLPLGLLLWLLTLNNRLYRPKPRYADMPAEAP